MTRFSCAVVEHRLAAPVRRPPLVRIVHSRVIARIVGVGVNRAVHAVSHAIGVAAHQRVPGKYLVAHAEPRIVDERAALSAIRLRTS